MDVPGVVDEVVQEVAAERLHGEGGAVGAPPRALPLVLADPGEPAASPPRRLDEPATVAGSCSW